MRSLKVGFVVLVMAASSFVAAPQSSALTTSEIETALATRIFNIINNNRATRGKVRLGRRAVINQQAAAHTNWLAANGYGQGGFADSYPHYRFSSSAGGPAPYRIDAIDAAYDVSQACENVVTAWGYTDYKQVATVFYNAWLRSQSGHRQCMFDQSFNGFKNNADIGGIDTEKRGTRWFATFIAAKN